MNETLPNTDQLTSKCDACGAPIPEGRRLCGQDTGDAFCQAPEDYAHGYDLGYEAGWKARLDPKLFTNRAEIVEALQAIVTGLGLAIAEQSETDQ